MTLKVLILLCVYFASGEVTELEDPDLVYNERFLDLGPSTIHSIKGKFYEEKQRQLQPVPITNNKSVPKLNPAIDMADYSHHTPANKTEELSQNEPSPSQQQNKKDQLIKFPTPDANNDRDILSLLKFKTVNSVPNQAEKTALNTPNSIPLVAGENHFQKTEINRSNNNTSTSESPKIHFHTEKVTSNLEKNETTETIKKELEFDSLLIKNNFSNISMLDPPHNIMNSYVNNGINPEEDILYNSVTPPMKDPRRLETIPYYPPIQPPFYTTLLKTSSNIIQTNPNVEPTKYGNNFLNNINTGRRPLGENNYNPIGKGICDDKESDDSLDRSGDDIQIIEPTKGSGISNVVKSRMMLMNHPRVCYACSSISDPSCWSPDRRTSVKYCRGDHPSCLTKLYKFKGLSYTIRDCGKVCDQPASAEGLTKHTSCTICHHDLCNNSYSIKIQNITIFMFLIFNLQVILKLSSY